MKYYVTLLPMLLGLVIGTAAGHYHGKADVYADMFDQQAMLAEAINE